MTGIWEWRLRRVNNREKTRLDLARNSGKGKNGQIRTNGENRVAGRLRFSSLLANKSTSGTEMRAASSGMPGGVTHRYHPRWGAARNLCALAEKEARATLQRLRPELQANYLERRWATEAWLADASAKVLRRNFGGRPAYFFLGDFSYHGDASRPEALVMPLARLPREALTFTLGDSMSVAEEAEPRVYSFAEMEELFASGELPSRFSFSNAGGFAAKFVELQVWDTAWRRNALGRAGEHRHGGGAVEEPSREALG
jgi:hypothetical protein